MTKLIIEQKNINIGKIKIRPTYTIIKSLKKETIIPNEINNKNQSINKINDKIDNLLYFFITISILIKN